MGRVRAARDETRQAVLEAARLEFVDKGYYGASLNDVAGRAGLTKGAIYSNWPGKRALFIESFLDGDTPRQTPRSPRDTTAAAALRTMATLRLPAANSTSRRSAALAYELLTLILRDEDELEVLAEVRALLSFLVARSFELLATPEGHVPTVVHDDVAGAFLTIIDGARLRRSVDEDLLPRDVLLGLCEGLASLPGGSFTPVAGEPVPVIERDPVAVAPVFDQIRRDEIDLHGPVGLLGVGGLRQVPQLVRQASAAGHSLTCVVVNSPQHRDMAMLVERWAADYVDLIRAAFPARAHPDFGLVFDVDGVVPSALGVEAGDDVDIGLRAEDGKVVAESLTALAVAVSPAG